MGVPLVPVTLIGRLDQGLQGHERIHSLVFVDLGDHVDGVACGIDAAGIAVDYGGTFPEVDICELFGMGPSGYLEG